MTFFLFLFSVLSYITVSNQTKIIVISLYIKIEINKKDLKIIYISFKFGFFLKSFFPLYFIFIVFIFNFFNYIAIGNEPRNKIEKRKQNCNL